MMMHRRTFKSDIVYPLLKVTASICRFSSQALHRATPVSIMESSEIELTGMSKVTQQY